MIKTLKLQKAVILLVLGLIAMLVSWLMTKNSIKGDKFVLGLSGVLLILGAIMFLFPIFFAKKLHVDDDTVVLGTETEEGLIEEKKEPESLET